MATPTGINPEEMVVWSGPFSLNQFILAALVAQRGGELRIPIGQIWKYSPDLICIKEDSEAGELVLRMEKREPPLSLCVKMREIEEEGLE